MRPRKFVGERWGNRNRNLPAEYLPPQAEVDDWAFVQEEDVEDVVKRTRDGILEPKVVTQPVIDEVSREYD